MTPPRIGRRGFIRLGLLGAVGASLGLLRWRAAPHDVLPFARWTLRRSWQQLAGPPSAVALVPCPAYAGDVLAGVREVWQLMGNPSLRGKRVVLKPNLVGYVPGPPANTHSRVVEAVIALCREQGAREVTVAEGVAFARDSLPVLQQTGLAAAMSGANVPFVDLNYDDLREVRLSGGYSSLDTLSLPATVLDADCVISLPKMKTHHWASLTLSMKNMFGVVPGIRYGWPKNALHVAGISPMILDLYDSIRPQYAIVDGIVGMEGDGPLLGTEVPSGLLVGGQDLVAVDATCARLMGFDPAGVDYLMDAQTVGLGWLDAGRIEVRGGRLVAPRTSTLRDSDHEAHGRRICRPPRAVHFHPLAYHLCTWYTGICRCSSTGSPAARDERQAGGH